MSSAASFLFDLSATKYTEIMKDILSLLAIYVSARPMIRIVLKNIIKDGSISWKQQRCQTEDHYLEYPQQLIIITVASATTFSIVSLTRIPSHQKHQIFI